MQPACRATLATVLLYLAVCPRPMAETWSQLESPNFIMYTTATEREARALFGELEGFRALLLKFINVDIPPDADKVEIMLFRSHNDFRDYTWSYDVGGYVIPTETSAIIVQPARSRADATSVIYHEYVHAVLRHYPGRLPGWYSEGLAEVFGATRYAHGKFDIAMVPEDRLKAFAYRGRMASFDDIVADKFRSHRPSVAYDPYVQYWMLTYYLEIGNKDRRKDLGSFLLLYKDGMEALQAFEIVFGMAPEELWENEMKRFFSRGRIPALRVEMPLENVAVSYGPADMAAVDENLLILRAASVAAMFQRGDYREGRALVEELIEEMDPGTAQFLGMINNYVWLLATSLDEKVRNGTEAVRLGELYIKDRTENSAYLDSLAAAYAEAGRFDEAASLQADLVANLDETDENYAGFAERLASYRNRQPWRQVED